MDGFGGMDGDDGVTFGFPRTSGYQSHEQTLIPVPVFKLTVCPRTCFGTESILLLFDPITSGSDGKPLSTIVLFRWVIFRATDYT
jgi:hypothetical protein